MSDVIRKAIIDIEIRSGGAGVRLPNLERAIAQQRDLADAQREVATEATAQAEALGESNEMTDEAADRLANLFSAQEDSIEALHAEAEALDQATAEREAAAAASADLADQVAEEANNHNQLERANNRLVSSYVKVVSGSANFTRGLILMAGAESEVTAEALKYVAAGQAVVDIVQGAEKVHKALAAAYAAEAAAAAAGAVATGRLGAAIAVVEALLSPVIIVLAALAGAVYVIAGAVDALTTSEAEAKEAAEAHAKAVREQVNVIEELRGNLNTQNESYREYVTNLDTAEEKVTALTDAIAHAAETQAFWDSMKDNSTDPEIKEAWIKRSIDGLNNQKNLNKDLLDVEKSRADARVKAIDDEIKMVKLREDALQQAKQELDVAKQRESTMRDSVGHLTASGRKKLDTALDHAEQGTITKRDARILEEAGGGFAEIAAKMFFEKLDTGQTARGAKLAAALGGDRTAADREAEFQKRLAERDKLTGGKSAEEYIATLEGAKQAIVDEFEKLSNALREKIRALITEIDKLNQEAAQQRAAFAPPDMN